MNNLIIVGAGGFGREVLQWSIDAGFSAGSWTIKGFLDDDANALKPYPDIQYSIIGKIDEYEIQQNDRFACAVGLPKIKKNCVERILNRGGKFVSIIHPRTVIGRNVQYGPGCVICPGAILTSDIVVGDYVIINCQSSIGHDAKIGSWATLFCHCDITGYVNVGEGVMMGSHSSIIPGIRVEDWAVIGAGSVVMVRVPVGDTVIGVPAKKLFV